MTLLAGALGGVAAAAASAALGGLKQMTGQLKGLVSEAIQTAGRVNEMGLVTQLVGQRAGFSSEQIDEYTQSVIKAGIRTDIAQNLIAQMARQQLDLSQASKLARVAQDAAVLSMSNSSETLARIQYGIQTYQTEVLRTAGLNINMQGSFKMLAKELGKSTAALTESEKQQAALNAVLAEGAKIAGTYELAMTSPSKALRSLPRYFFEIKSAIGAPFQDAFGTAIQTVTKLTKALLAAVQEGGALYPLLVKLGAVASLIADGFAALVDKVLPAVTSITGEVEGGITGLISKAFNWGANIVIQLSEGIINAASTVLSKAISSLGRILSGWLAPGSPPKVAPDLRKWGVGWMAELFAGVPDAMQGVLADIQGPLQTLFEGADFAKLSRQVTGLLGKGDRKGVLNVLSGADEDFGPILADLAESEFNLADAIEAVTQAELDLEAAQKRVLAVQGKVSSETDEYNRLLREGASQDVLDAQLARINAAEEERKAALEAEKAAAANLEKREVAADTAQDEVSGMKDLLDQLFMYNRALQEQEEVPLIGAGGGIVPPDAPEFAAVGGIDIGGAIGAAVDAAKEQIKEKFRGLLGSVRKVWEEGLAELRNKWNVFVAGLGLAWDRIKKKYPILQEVEDWVVGIPEKIGTMIANGWDLFKGALEAVWSYIETYVSPLLVTLRDVVIETLKGKVLDLALAWFGEGGLLDGLKQLKKFWDEKLGPLMSEIWPKVVEAFRLQYLNPLIEGFNWFKEGLEKVNEILGKVLEKIRTANLKKMDALIGHSPSPLAIGISTAADAMERMAKVSLPQMNAAMGAYRGAGAATFRPAGTTTNTTSNQFNFNSSISSGIDQVSFEAMVMRTIRRALSEAA